MSLNHWWVTRPKRNLYSVPECLAIFSELVAKEPWKGNTPLQLQFEEQLEECGIKGKGTRRDRGGSGARTYKAWLFSLGLIFDSPTDGRTYLTLAGEALLLGKNPVEVLKKQVLNYQFPSSFSLAGGREKNSVNPRFRIRPFIFLLSLLMDKRIGGCLSKEEIAKVVAVQAESESCFESVVQAVLAYREKGDASLPRDFIARYIGTVSEKTTPFRKLLDTADTCMDWLLCTQLVVKANKCIRLAEGKHDEVESILKQKRKKSLIDKPEDIEYFQRKYGVDPYHQKDTRNMLDSKAVTSLDINVNKICRAFISMSRRKMILNITQKLVDDIAIVTGVPSNFVEKTLLTYYPRGGEATFLADYYEKAFKGREQAIPFEEATADIFSNVFGFKAEHIGQSGAKSCPDIVLISDESNFQAIIDTKAYASYSISGDHHNRMVHNYIEGINNYSNHGGKDRLAFFSYVAGDFSSNFDRQLNKVCEESHVHGSGISVAVMLKLIEANKKAQFSHDEIKTLFSCDRKICISDI